MNCLLVSPEVRGQTFWVYPATWRLRGAGYVTPPLGLATVAALLPEDWNPRILDCNLEQLREEHWQWADILLVGGMITQQNHHLELLQTARQKGIIVVCGGADPSSSPHLYSQADHLVLGEAEVTLPLFLEDFRQGRAQPIYRSQQRANLHQSPAVRWDLLQLGQYLYTGVQWSRGCPFTCEFCDIIELYGRVPRHKSIPQILDELEVLYGLGYRGHLEIVDDNLIGNPKVLLPILEAVAEWQKRRGYPFEFSGEASLNLSDRTPLLEALRKANFCAIFVGIETPHSETLKRAQKYQNTRRDTVASVHKLYSYGLHVYAGYIVGMDDEAPDMVEEMVGCIQDSAIPVNMAGLLVALPTTQLARRLHKEGRLPEDYDQWPQDLAGDQCVAGLNFATQRPRAQVLRDYRNILLRIYHPKAYFERVRALSQKLNMSGHRLGFDWRRFRLEAQTFGRLVWKLGVLSPWRGLWWRVFLQTLLFNPLALRYVLWLTAFWLHFEEFVPQVLGKLESRLEKERFKPQQPRS